METQREAEAPARGRGEALLEVWESVHYEPLSLIYSPKHLYLFIILFLSQSGSRRGIHMLYTPA